jgi:hypothetical protein
MQHNKPIFPPKDFKTSVLDSVLKNTENLKQKVQLIKNWQQTIRSKKIYAFKEKQLQVSFLHTFFGDILGYDYDTHLSVIHLSNEIKTTKDQTKVDGALGYFTYNAEEEKMQGDVRVQQFPL